MLYYGRTGFSEGNDAAKWNDSKKCIICHFWFFKHEFKFQDSACNGCHYLMMLSLNISDIATVAVKGVDYCCIIHVITKSEAIRL